LKTFLQPQRASVRTRAARRILTRMDLGRARLSPARRSRNQGRKPRSTAETRRAQRRQTKRNLCALRVSAVKKVCLEFQDPKILAKQGEVCSYHSVCRDATSGTMRRAEDRRALPSPSDSEAHCASKKPGSLSPALSSNPDFVGTGIGEGDARLRAACQTS